MFKIHRMFVEINCFMKLGDMSIAIHIRKPGKVPCLNVADNNTGLSIETNCCSDFLVNKIKSKKGLHKWL